MRKVLIAVAVVAAGAAASIPFIGRSGGSLDPVAAAATKTAAAAGYHMGFTATVTVAGMQVGMHGSGAADPSTSSSDLTFTYTGLPASVGDTDTEVVEVGKTVYMKTGLFQGRLPDGKTWLSVDLAKAVGALGGSLPSVSQVDPSQWLQALRAVASVQKIGTDTVQDEQMTHYRAVVDTTKLAHLPAANGVAVRAQLQRLGLTSIPIDVWVDANGMLRQESLDVSTSLLQMTMTGDFSDFGSTVSVSAPPAAQVFDATQLALKAAKH